MSEVFITRKGGGGKASAPELLITEVGGSWIEFEVTNNDQSQPAQIFLLANYDTNATEDFDFLAIQNGKVITVAAGDTVTEFITGLDPAITHTISAQAAVIKKLPSNIVTTAPTNLLQNGIPAPTIGPIVQNNPTSTVVTVKNNDLTIPVIIRAVATTSTTVPTNYPFATSSLGPDSATSLTITGLSAETTYYIHARAFDGDIQSANVVFGPYTTPEIPLYAFTSWTFTNAGATARTGPTIAQVRSAYSSQTWAQNNSYLSMTVAGMQNWTVPLSGTYRIEAFGAQGGGSNGGLGARMRGDFSLTKGQVLRILVGQRGTNGGTSDQNSQGGGGGSFVVASPYNTLASARVVAGGGGGSQGTFSANRNAPTTQAGLAGAGSSGSAGGGSNGTGGGATVRSSGGGGFTGNGANGTDGSTTGGASFVNGGVGGNGSPGGFGGFGGGGGTWQTGWRGSGGGGGYSGGGSGYHSSNTTNHSGGGGGSINTGTNPSNSAGARSGQGQVIITRL
jgi:hypothetical protein